MVKSWSRESVPRSQCRVANSEMTVRSRNVRAPSGVRARSCLSAGFVALAVACSPTGPSKGDLEVGAAIVYGRVTLADGTAVGQAQLHTRVYASCATQNDSTLVGGSGSDHVQVNWDGSYRSLVRVTDARSYCIVVTVDALPSTGPAATRTPGVMAVFKFPSISPIDSVKVDVVMQPISILP